MSRRALRLAVVSAAALIAVAAALVVAFATSTSTSTRPLSKFAAGDPDGTAATRFGNGNELLGRADYEASKDAYPGNQLSPAWTVNAKATYERIATRSKTGTRAPVASPFWEHYGPLQSAVQPGELDFSGSEDHTASRTVAIAISANCTPSDCRMWAGPAGGGVWRTENALAASPTWSYLSSPFDQNSIGDIVLDPNDPTQNTLYVGTGEPNSCSSGCAAGVGLYKSTNGGDAWTKVAGACISNGTYACVTPNTDAFRGRGISEIVVEPGNVSHLLVGSATAARSISHIIGLGGQVRFTEPGANTPGLYESLDSGKTFTPVWLPNTNTASPGPGRRGVIDVGLDPRNSGTVYASAYDVGVYRRCTTTAGNASCGGEVRASQFDFKQVFRPRFPGTDVERTMFDMTIKSGLTRVYLTTGQTGNSPGGTESPSSFWRLDNANQPAATLLASEPNPPAAAPVGGNPGGPGASTYSGWRILTSPSTGSPYYATNNFCTGQCWYDQDVYTPKIYQPGNPTAVSYLADRVYVIGSYNYGEVPCYTHGVGCGSGISNSRAILFSNTAGDPDPSHFSRTFTDMSYEGSVKNASDQPSNNPYCAYEGFSNTCFGDHESVHPDQHEILINPTDAESFFEASDGGIVRATGGYDEDLLIQSCDTIRGLGGNDLATCQRLLSRVPKDLHKINDGTYGSTLQFVNVAPEPRDPAHVIGGTQDNGTWHNRGSVDNEGIWHNGAINNDEFTQTIYGDGGNAGFDTYPNDPALPAGSKTGESWMFNEFTSAFGDANFRGGVNEKWVIITGPLAASGETVAFYWPQISDPNPPFVTDPDIGAARTHPIFSGLQHVWRSWAFGAGASPGNGPRKVPQSVVPQIATYEANCQEFYVAGNTVTCGDFQPMGGPRGANQPGDLTGTVYGTDRAGGAVSWISRRAADTNTLWATTSAGRVFVTFNAHAPDTNNVVWYRVDNLPTTGFSNNCPTGPTASPANPTAPPPGAVNCSPTRHPNAIYPDANPNNAGVAYLAYSGYNAATPGTPGHVFRVALTRDVNGVPTAARFQNLAIESGGTSSNPTPQSSGDLPVNDVVMDDGTKKLYAATDFGVLVGTASTSAFSTTSTYTWGTTVGMPTYEVSHLAMTPSQRDACLVCGNGRVLYAATHSRGIWRMTLGTP